MKWYEHLSQDTVRESYELQLAGDAMDDSSFSAETNTITDAVREWLSIRKLRAADVYIAITAIRKYHTPLVDFWNLLQENEFKTHAEKYKSISACFEIVDASTGKRTSYSISPLMQVVD